LRRSRFSGRSAVSAAGVERRDGMVNDRLVSNVVDLQLMVKPAILLFHSFKPEKERNPSLPGIDTARSAIKKEVLYGASARR
jgi:hypothetical protein